jgi:hypothetical protein
VPNINKPINVKSQLKKKKRRRNKERKIGPRGVPEAKTDWPTDYQL